jgi:hypothetical protein
LVFLPTIRVFKAMPAQALCMWYTKNRYLKLLHKTKNIKKVIN